ncbi:SDR family NAD(P)-dependent oxidoreductase [Prescottella subtropica]|uniref:SDR family NAD(P)-dependent oxidoreductase n=1 Tax=Prescottella subtropica TaxID=2545757 RepID=UPI0010F719C2|nr:SDR family oxidoreductase [Prescottella subtropica]
MGVLDGDVALVTGAGRGIGRGIALALAAEGARVAVVGRTLSTVAETAREIDRRGGNAVALRCDVTDARQIDETVSAVVETYGGLSILVNNAQIPAHGRLLDADESAYRDGMDSGPLAAWRLMRACHPHLSGRGSIVNMGSAAGMRSDPSGSGLYAAAKEAVRVLTRTAACEWGGDGIRVNAILPLASSPAMDEWAELDPQAHDEYLRGVPLGRLGDPETDIGPAVVFLCSPAARYITGHALPVDGGQAHLR